MAASNFARSSVGLEALICFINSGDKATQKLRNGRAPFSPRRLPPECIMHFFFHIILQKKIKRTWIRIWGKNRANAQPSPPPIYRRCHVESWITVNDWCYRLVGVCLRPVGRQLLMARRWSRVDQRPRRLLPAVFVPVLRDLGGGALEWRGWGCAPSNRTGSIDHSSHAQRHTHAHAHTQSRACPDKKWKVQVQSWNSLFFSPYLAPSLTHLHTHTDTCALPCQAPPWSRSHGDLPPRRPPRWSTRPGLIVRFVANYITPPFQIQLPGRLACSLQDWGRRRQQRGAHVRDERRKSRWHVWRRSPGFHSIAAVGGLTGPEWRLQADAALQAPRTQLFGMHLGDGGREIEWRCSQRSD